MAHAITRRPEHANDTGTGAHYYVLVDGLVVGGTYRCPRGYRSWGSAGLSGTHRTREAAEQVQAAAYLATWRRPHVDLAAEPDPFAGLDPTYSSSCRYCAATITSPDPARGPWIDQDGSVGCTPSTTDLHEHQPVTGPAALMAPPPEPEWEPRIQPADNLPDRVAAGCDWLDRVRPGWHVHIDLDRMDMGSDRWCVAGQLWGAWAHTPAMHTADGRKLSAPVVGMLAVSLTVPLREFSHQTLAGEYAALTAEWRRVIQQRRDADR